MNVRELIDILNQVENKDAEVILSKNLENYDYYPLTEVESENCGYTPESDVNGYYTFLKFTPEIESMGFSKEDVDLNFTEQTVPAVYLW